MGFLDYVPIVGDLINKTHNIVDQVVEDKDKKNEILQNLQVIGQQVYLKELETKTVPWIDAIHKMGRQILNFTTIIAVVALLLLGIEITPTVAIIMGGPNAAYQIVKGKGKE